MYHRHKLLTLDDVDNKIDFINTLLEYVSGYNPENDYSLKRPSFDNTAHAELVGLLNSDNDWKVIIQIAIDQEFSSDPSDKEFFNVIDTFF